MPDNEVDDVPIFNPSILPVPSGGLAQIVSIDPSTGAGVIAPPSYDSQPGLIVVGRFGVQPQSGGFGSYRPRVVLAYDGTLGVPSVGSNLGSKAGSYLAGSGKYGFICLGGTGPVYTNGKRADEKATAQDRDCVGYGWINPLDDCKDCLRLTVLEANGACGPTPKTYNCLTIDGVPTCMDPGDGSGFYRDLNHCLATGCAPPPPPPPGPSYNCVTIDGDGYCVDPGDGTGVYTTVADCVAANCLPPPVPPSPITYDCVNVSGTMRCRDPGDGTGFYTGPSALSDCEAAPCSNPGLPYACIDGACAFDSSGAGQYATFEECQAACGAADTSGVCGGIHPTSTGGTFTIDAVSGPCPGFVVPTYSYVAPGNTLVWFGTGLNSSTITVTSDGEVRFFYRTASNVVYYFECIVWNCDDDGKLVIKGQFLPFTGDPCPTVIMNFTITLN